MLTVTHGGGDALRVQELALRGEGLVVADGADMSGPGRWAGAASGSFDRTAAAVAGESVTVGVGLDYVCHVAWMSADGGIAHSWREITGRRPDRTGVAGSDRLHTKLI